MPSVLGLRPPVEGEAALMRKPDDMDIVAIEQVQIPKAGILEGNVFDAHIRAVVDEHQPRALDIEVGGGRVGGAPGIKQLPERRAVAVELALAADAHMVHSARR